MAKKKNNELQVIETKEKNVLLEDRIDTESIRNELKEYVDEQINKTFIEELEKSNKRLIREKNRKIIWKNIVIILLLLIIAFLLYLLFANNYFDKYFNKNSNIVEKEKTNEKEEEKEEKNEEKEPEVKKEPTLDELKKEYSSLLDNYYVTDSSIYLSEFYDGKLTNDMMKYMTLNSFNFSTIEKEEDYNIIEESTFKVMFEKLFNEDYVAGTFNYDENKVRYVKAMESYMTESILVREESNIKREIKDIKVDGEKILITTVEGVVKDNKLHNIISNEEVSSDKDDSLVKYEDKLNKLVYTFKDNKLISLSK